MKLYLMRKVWLGNKDLACIFLNAFIPFWSSIKSFDISTGHCERIFLHRPAVVKAIEEAKLSFYGDNYDEESDHLGKEKVGEASRKRKEIAENAAKDYDWADLADNGQVKLSVLSVFQ